MILAGSVHQESTERPLVGHSRYVFTTQKIIRDSKLSARGMGSGLHQHHPIDAISPLDSSRTQESSKVESQSHTARVDALEENVSSLIELPVASLREYHQRPQKSP